MVAAARAGYNVAAFDLFNDIDTRRCCFYSAQVKFANGGFDAGDLWRCLNAGDLSADTVVLYGSGLEGQPQLLEQLASRYSLLGNAAGTVTEIKNPRRFFSLLDRLDIAHPETVFDAPADAAGWLVKSAGGSGGMHVRHFDGRTGDYYQRLVEGLPVSLLFLADGKNIGIVGYNEQWIAPASGMPYRFGGAVGNADLPREAKAAIATAAKKITAATGLCGLNSMDFLLGEQGPLALEVNPRLSASFELYDVPDLLDRHLQACRGQLVPLPAGSQGANASLIHYASHDFEVSENAIWPEWTTDHPVAGSRIRAGEPMCSVQAHAENASQAKALAFARARQLDAQYQPSLKT